MEAVIDHVVEASVASPPPRAAHLPLHLTLLLTVAVLLLGLFVLGSGRALWEAGKLIWIAQAGHTAMGRVVAIQTEPAPGQDKPLLQVAVRYQAAIPNGRGQMLSRSGWVGLPRSVVGVKAMGAAAWQIGQAIPVRYASWFGGVASRPGLAGASGQIVSLLFCGSLVLLVSLLLARRLWRWMQDRLHLLRRGVATVGTIVHKRTEAEDMLRYFLRYGYAPVPGEGREIEEQVSPEQWKQFAVGQPVTVLYDSDHPERAGLYALLKG